MSAPIPVAKGLRLRVADPRRDRHAARAIESLPGAGVFHTAAWARTLHAAYGFRTQLLLAEDPTGAVAAAVPVTPLRGWLRGARAVSQPMADECALLARDAAARDFLHSAALALARSRGWRHWELRGAGAPSQTTPATSYHGHLVPLDPADWDCPAAAAPSVHRGVRQAVRAGVEVEFGDSENLLRRFHCLYARTRQRHGAPPAPWRFFEAMRKELLVPGHGVVALAARDGEDLAGGLFLLSGRNGLYKYGASDPSRHHLRPNHLVMARAADWCARRGCTALDLGRTSLGAEGLRRYKLSWGATERFINYTRLRSADGQALLALDRAGRWPAPLLRRLPPPLLRALGAVLHPLLA